MAIPRWTDSEAGQPFSWTSIARSASARLPGGGDAEVFEDCVGVLAPQRHRPPAPPARSDNGLYVAYAPPTRLSFGVVQSLATFSCYAYASGRRWI